MRGECRLLGPQSLDQPRIISRHPELIQDVALGVEPGQASDPADTSLILEQALQAGVVDMVRPHPAPAVIGIGDVVPAPEAPLREHSLRPALRKALHIGMFDGENSCQRGLLHAKVGLALETQLVEDRVEQDDIRFV